MRQIFFAQYYSLSRSFNTRDEIPVRRTSVFVKLLYSDGNITKEQTAELLEYCIELRRRVKEQLMKMNPFEFTDVSLRYIDHETGEEFIVSLPEVGKCIVNHGKRMFILF